MTKTYDDMTDREIGDHEKSLWIADFVRVYTEYHGKGDPHAVAEAHYKAAAALGLSGDEAADELMHEETPCWLE